ncbi:MAG: N-acetylmuramoyl-L-alanine amidase [Synergistetes bacterium]|nr:N-acetylmuramoyl-L-alanine amidase [Synergistota bacterium]
MRKKRCVIVFLSLFLVLLLSSVGIAANTPIFINGKRKGAVPTFTVKGIRYVAIKDLVQTLGGKFKYKPETGAFSFVLGGKLYQLQLNNPTALVNGKIRLLDYFPKAVGNKICIPLNFILSNTSLRFDPKQNVLYVGAKPAVRQVPSLPGKPPSTPVSTPAIEVKPAKPLVVVPPAKKEPLVFLSRVRYYSSKTYTRIVLDLSKVPNYKIKGNRDLIIVDLSSTKAPRRETYKIRDGLVGDVEVIPGERNSQIRIKVKGFPPYRDFTLKQPPRLVIDVLRKAPQKPPTPVVPETPSRPQKLSPRGEKETIKIRPQGKGKFLIVVDPGHGGKDPGAVGPRGTKEKDIALRVALYLKNELIKRGYRVILTRNKDVYLSLKERTYIANRSRADVFISIHCNASFSPSARGSEVYYMALPSDSSAMSVALRENMEIGLTGEEVKRKTDMLVRILADMMKNAKIDESAKFAESLYRSLKRGLRIPVRRIAQAPFFVLRGAVMPAVLVELAFITNPREETLLRRASWQRKVAILLAKGVENYLSSVR